MGEPTEGTATIDVTVRITAKVASEFVTNELVCDHVARHRGKVLRAIEQAGHPRGRATRRLGRRQPPGVPGRARGDHLMAGSEQHAIVVAEADHYRETRRRLAADPIVRKMARELEDQWRRDPGWFFHSDGATPRHWFMTACRDEYRDRGGRDGGHLGAVAEARSRGAPGGNPPMKEPAVTGYAFATNTPRHTARGGQPCQVVRRLTYDEADLAETGPMFRVRFSDGAEIDAYADELSPVFEVDAR